MFKALLSLFLCAFISLVHAAGSSEDYVLSQSYFEDTSNELSVDQVQHEKFTPYEGWLTKGYSKSTYWIKLKIRPSKDDLVLRIRPTYAESIQLFNPLNVDSSRVTGARYLWQESDIQSYNHNFNLGVLKQEQEIFLKVKSHRTYLLSLDVIPKPIYLGKDHVDGLLYFGYIIFTLSLALGLLGAWLNNRELVLGVFTVQQFIAFAHTFFVVGYARIFLDRFIGASAVNYGAYIVVVAYPLVAILANKLLFREYGLKTAYKWVFNCLLLISSAVILLMLFGYVGLSLKLNALVVMTVVFVFCLTAWFGTTGVNNRANMNLPIRYLQIYYALSAIMWSISVLPLLGFVQGGELTVHLYLLHNVISGLIFFWLLQYRARSILKNELTKSEALKKEVQNEKSRREEQGKLMAMLTHEIRTPLSVLKLVIDRKVAGSDLEDYANRAVGNIDSIIDKCIQLDRLDLDSLKIHKSTFNFKELLEVTMIDAQVNEQFVVLDDLDIEMDSDYEMVKVIVSNLIINAKKYAEPQSKVIIRYVASGNDQPSHLTHLRFSIQNELSHLGAPDPMMVFEKYYRGTAATKISGSGLGLFLVKQLTQALGGEVKCDINHDSITFTVWIPV